jgi:hypothetical protein
VNGAEEIAVIGERDRRHAEVHGALHEVADAARAVEQAHVGVIVQVDEGRGCARRFVLLHIGGHPSQCSGRADERQGNAREGSVTRRA